MVAVWHKHVWPYARARREYNRQAVGQSYTLLDGLEIEESRRKCADVAGARLDYSWDVLPSAPNPVTIVISIGPSDLKQP